MFFNYQTWEFSSILKKNQTKYLKQSFCIIGDEDRNPSVNQYNSPDIFSNFTICVENVYCESNRLSYNRQKGQGN